MAKETCTANGTDDFGDWQCDKGVKARGLCGACYSKRHKLFTRPIHLLPKTCVAVGVDSLGPWTCDKKVIARGLCKTHYDHDMAGTGIARILKRPPVQHGAVCSANGTDDIGAWQCDRPVKIASAGLCAGCYLKHLMSAPFTRPAHLKPTTCVAVAAGGGGLCGDPVVARGRCDMHLSRRKRGTPDDAPLTVSVRGQEAAAYAAEGKKWCATCKQAKCLADFSSGSNGLTQPTCRDCRRWNQMLRTFRITRDEYETLVANQGDACGFCGTDKPGGSGQWHIDHFHGCTEGHAPEKGCQFCIRSLLCNRCNMRLVADYEALPPDRQTWGDMARYLARRPILEMRFAELTDDMEQASEEHVPTQALTCAVKA